MKAQIYRQIYQKLIQTIGISVTISLFFNKYKVNIMQQNKFQAMTAN